jgi:hypothetical protein
MIARDWKKRKINCSNTEWIFRLIQSIPSKKAEPFKLWLANEKPEWLTENKKVANRWWSVAKNARIETEKEIGKKVSVEKNYLNWGDSKLKLL